ncbi:MAG: peptidase [Anaerolineae bacterium]|nr:peptidase [Gloeobacterales cyanobacterium ES-bin-313]
MLNKYSAIALLAGSLALTPLSAKAAATIAIVNGDPAGVGFNDTTPVTPVGGNTGTTLGAQRLIAFQAAADKWGATLSSSVTINVLATWEALSCTSTSAVLGSAGAITIFSNFASAPVPNRWYSQALTNKLSGVDVDPANADLRARFNVNLGQTNCLTGTFFYLGLDNNAGTNVDLVAVLLHEFGHGLGFQTYTSGSTGAQISGSSGPLPSIWDDFLFDTTINKSWSAMTNSERVTSAINTGKLVWSGATVNTALPSVLQLGTPVLAVSAPTSVAGSYLVGPASFGPALSSPGLTSETVFPYDTAPNLSLACSPLSAGNAALVAGKIALLDRGTCAFTVKVKNAQDAGAIGVIIADNVAGSPPPGLGGTDATITIPAVRITQADGNAFKAAVASSSRRRTGLFVNLGLNLSIYSGADASGRALMYAPNPFSSGSSVSHFDVSALPNLLMEPSINPNLPQSVTAPLDLTFPLLQDIGW